MEVSNYYTVAGYGMYELVVKRSRFIARVNRAETEEDALSFIREAKRLYRDATHNCSAYIVGKSGEIQKACDDGEPSGTAGIPMLEVLKKRQLRDTVVVVTRYFGGIKLGASGLIRAYGRAATEVLRAGGIVRCRLMRNVCAVIDYPLLGKVQNQLQHSSYAIKNIEYLERVYIYIYIPYGGERHFMDWMINITGGQCQFKEGEMEYLEEKIP